MWPAVVPLPTPSDVLVGEPDRVALGARSPSTDDASLRDYREGDDLRRVHWSSSARKGALMVRSDERAGMRPVSVLLDLPARATSLEWSISLAASMSLAMLDGGHPVRLVSGGTDAAAAYPLAFVHDRSGPGARSALLDRTIDLEAPRSAVQGEAALVAAAHLLHTTEAGGEIVLAVLGPLGASARAALAHVADAALAWAVVRADTPAQEAEAEHTIKALRRAGWRACRVTPGEPSSTAGCASWGPPSDRPRATHPPRPPVGPRLGPVRRRDLRQPVRPHRPDRARRLARHDVARSSLVVAAVVIGVRAVTRSWWAPTLAGTIVAAGIILVRYGAPPGRLQVLPDARLAGPDPGHRARGCRRHQRRRWCRWSACAPPSSSSSSAPSPSSCWPTSSRSASARPRCPGSRSPACGPPRSSSASPRAAGRSPGPACSTCSCSPSAPRRASAHSDRGRRAGVAVLCSVSLIVATLIAGPAVAAFPGWATMRMPSFGTGPVGPMSLSDELDLRESLGTRSGTGRAPVLRHAGGRPTPEPTPIPPPARRARPPSPPATSGRCAPSR